MTGTFVTVECRECGNEQIVFDRPAADVECLVCDEVIAASAGGRAVFRADVVDEVA